MTKIVNDFCCIFHQAEKFALSTNRGSKKYFDDESGAALGHVVFGFEWIGSKVVKQNDFLMIQLQLKIGWWFQICFMFIPIWGKWSNLTIIFFRWVGSTTNQKIVFTQDFVSSLKTLYSWVCVLKCTYTEATVHYFTLPFSLSTCCNALFI